MPVEVVGRQVGEDRHIGGERTGKVGLVGRQFQHDHLTIARRVDVEHPAPDVSRELRGPSCLGQDVVNERRCGGFAVRPRNRDHAGRLVHLVPFAATQRAKEQPDVVVDRHTLFIGPRDMGVGGRIKMRNAGARDERRDTRESLVSGQIVERESRRLGPRPRLGPVVPAQRRRPARHERTRRGETGAAQPQNRDFLTFVTAHRDHASLLGTALQAASTG